MDNNRGTYIPLQQTQLFYAPPLRNLYIYLYLSVCLSVCLSIYLSNYLSICLSIYLSTYLSTYLSMCLSMAIEPFVGPWPIFSFLFLCTVGRTPWRGSARHKASIYTQNNTNRINAYRHPRLEWDSKPRPQCSSGRRLFLPL
jgi:hypothetical protein